MKSNLAKSIKKDLKKLRDKKIGLKKTEILLNRNAIVKKGNLDRYLKGGLGGVAAGTLAAIPFAVKYHKKKRQKNNNGEENAKFTGSDAAAIGGLGGAIIGSRVSKKDNPLNLVKNLKTVDETMLKSIDKAATKNIKKNLAFTAGGALVGYGAKKAYDHYKKKNKKK